MADAWDELISRHGLTFAEAVRIRDEVGTGRAFAEPHLRAAAAEWARHLLDREGIAQLWATRWRRVVLVVTLVAFVASVTRDIVKLETGQSSAGLWVGTLGLAANLLFSWNRRRLLRATITRNEGTPGSPHP